MRLTLSVELGYVAVDKIGGTLSFKGDGKSKVIKYHFNEEPKKNLEWGDQIDISFFDEHEESRIKGMYPDILESVPEKAICFWSLSNHLIYSLFMSYEGTPVKSVKKEKSGDVNDATFNLIFSSLPAPATS